MRKKATRSEKQQRKTVKEEDGKNWQGQRRVAIKRADHEGLKKKINERERKKRGEKEREDQSQEKREKKREVD